MGSLVEPKNGNTCCIKTTTEGLHSDKPKVMDDWTIQNYGIYLILEIPTKMSTGKAILIAMAIRVVNQLSVN